MAFRSTDWITLVQGFGPGPRLHLAKTTDIPSVWGATGYFAGIGVQGRTNRGAVVGDLVIVQQTSGSSLTDTAGSSDLTFAFGSCFLGSIVASTCNQASTVASSGYSAAWDVTIVGGGLGST